MVLASVVVVLFVPPPSSLLLRRSFIMIISNMLRMHIVVSCRGHHYFNSAAAHRYRIGSARCSPMPCPVHDEIFLWHEMMMMWSGRGIIIVRSCRSSGKSGKTQLEIIMAGEIGFSWVLRIQKVFVSLDPKGFRIFRIRTSNPKPETRNPNHILLHPPQQP